jgi:SnoaL-like domain
MTDYRCLTQDDAAIRNLLGLTALLGDEGAPEDYRRVYASDATWRMGTIEQTGADEIVAAAASRRADGTSGPGTGTRHLVIPMQVEVTGDSARAISRFLFLAGTAIAVAGTYRDELIRTSQGWRIAAREVTNGQP